MAAGNETERTIIGTSTPIKEYARLRGRILECVDGMAGLERSSDFPYEELKEKLETDSFNLVVVGQFKRGKTCLINALLGANILPVSVVPLTSIVTILSFGEELRVKVLFLDGTTVEADPEQLADYVTETGNPKNVKNVREVVITFPSPYLQDGVRLVDTPGVGSVYLHNTDVAYQYLPKSDAALFLLSVEQPVGQAELDFLKDVQQYSDRIFFLLNKIDYLTDDEIRESIAFSKEALKEVMGSDVKIFPISAKLALNGRLQHSDELLEESKLPAFSVVLNEFLIREKGKVLLLSAAGNLLRTLAQERLKLELERSSLETPIEELKEKLALFEEKKREILAERENLDILLDGELNRLIREGLEEDLSSFKGELTSRMEEGFDAFCNENTDLSLKELNNALESYVTSEVERAFSEWSTKERDSLATAYAAMCSRFVAKIDDIINDLLKFSSHLFSVPFEADAPESSWMAESSFSYKFGADAVGLDMLTDSLTQVLPGLISSRFKKIKGYLLRIANRMILNKRREHMRVTIDMQGGRIRFSFVEKLKESKQSFRQAMLRRIESTVEGIGLAIEEGMRQRNKGERELAETQKNLADKARRIDKLRDELLQIRDRATGM